MQEAMHQHIIFMNILHVDGRKYETLSMHQRLYHVCYLQQADL